jgi:hypothetical protein
MNERTLHFVGLYNSSFTEDDRDRSIASLFVAQDTRSLGPGEMRRDVLTYLNGPSMLNYWLNNRKWLEITRKVGKVTYVRPTAAGLNVCYRKHQPTANIDRWIKKMTVGEPGADTGKSFALS